MYKIDLERWTVNKGELITGILVDRAILSVGNITHTMENVDIWYLQTESLRQYIEHPIVAQDTVGLLLGRGKLNVELPELPPEDVV
jgi:hypothetical protein